MDHDRVCYRWSLFHTFTGPPLYSLRMWQHEEDFFSFAARNCFIGYSNWYLCGVTVVFIIPVMTPFTMKHPSILELEFVNNEKHFQSDMHCMSAGDDINRFSNLSQVFWCWEGWGWWWWFSIVTRSREFPMCYSGEHPICMKQEWGEVSGSLILWI